MNLRQLKREDLDSLSISFSEAFESQGFSQSSSRAYLGKKYDNYIHDDYLPTWSLISDLQEIACSYSALTIPYIKGASEKRVGLVCDVLTKPNYQKKGLFSQLGLQVKEKLSQEGIDFTIGFPVRENVTLQHLKVGWEYLFDMHIWATPIRLSGSLSKFIEVSTLDQYFDFSIIKFGLANAFVISPKALRTRFERLDCTYLVLRVKGSNQFAIVREAKIGRIKFLAIIHIQFEGLEDGKLLLNSISNMALKRGVFLVLGCWNENFAQDLQLKKLGLFKTSKVQNFIAREINSQIPRSDDEYQLSWLDTDAL
jgi:hypothetical protein